MAEYNAQLAERDEQVKRLRTALRPFAECYRRDLHPMMDDCRRASGVMDEESK